MCGIAGIYYFHNKTKKTSEISKMLDEINHRGPDGRGIYVKDNVELGHVLLKIQDVTDSSQQPYIFKNLVLVYNGEIYNYK